MDNVKFYDEDESQIRSLVEKVYIFSDIRMELNLKMCSVFVFNVSKIKCMDGLSIPPGEVTKMIEETNYKYLGLLEKINYLGGVLAQTLTDSKVEITHRE